MSNLVMFEQSCSKLTCDLWLSRLCMTLTFNPRSFKPFKIRDFVTFHVYCKFGKIWTIQLKVKKYFHFWTKTHFPKTSKSKNSFHQPLPYESMELSRVNGNFWLSQNVCTCYDFCKYLWQSFLHFSGNFPFLERVIKKLLLM